MSADNSVYIREMPNGKYAVKCISSFYINDQTTDEEIDKAFVDLPEFESIFDAWIEEERIQQYYEDSGGYIEYGTEVLTRKRKK